MRFPPIIFIPARDSIRFDVGCRVYEHGFDLNELHRTFGQHRFEANSLILVDVFDKHNPHRDTMFEIKARTACSLGQVALHMEPALRSFHLGDIEWGLGSGITWGIVTLGVNLMDTRDYFMLGRGRNVATARLTTSIANGNGFVIEYNQALGETDRI